MVSVKRRMLFNFAQLKKSHAVEVCAYKYDIKESICGVNVIDIFYFYYYNIFLALR